MQVFYTGQNKPVFFVASRGHHADIGGITPGIVMPNSQANCLKLLLCVLCSVVCLFIQDPCHLIHSICGRRGCVQNHSNLLRTEYSRRKVC